MLLDAKVVFSFSEVEKNEDAEKIYVDMIESITNNFFILLVRRILFDLETYVKDDIKAPFHQTFNSQINPANYVICSMIGWN